MTRIHTAEILDMAGFFAEDQLPQDPTTGNPLIQQAIRRDEQSVWRVRIEPFRSEAPDGPLAWSIVRAGDLVRIPMLPYRTHKDPAKAMLGGIYIVQNYLEAVPNCKRTHIVIGDPLQEVDGNFRFWIGFAAQIA